MIIHKLTQLCYNFNEIKKHRKGDKKLWHVLHYPVISFVIFAIKMIQDNLVDSYNGGMTKRASMHNTQCLAGMAFSNALLGIVHSIARDMNDALKIPRCI